MKTDPILSTECEICGNKLELVMSEVAILKSLEHINNLKNLKEYLLKLKKEIQTGKPLDRKIVREDERGEIAKDFWNDNKFTIGMEYGEIAMIEYLLKELKL